MRPSERGLTLTEVTLVTVLASLVMLGLVGFYMNSQATWMDASAQAITQREATALIDNIGERVHEAATATITDVSIGADGSQVRLELFDDGGNPLYSFWWSPVDSLIHEGVTPTQDRGAAVISTVERFQCVSNSVLVQITLRLRSDQGRRIELSTTRALFNAPPP